jgi:acetoin utilization protein AcuB
MFIVYSPEGQSFIGVPPPKPELRVDPVNPVRPIKELEEGKVNEPSEQSLRRKSGKAASEPLKAYEKIQEGAHAQKVVRVGEVMSSPVITIGIEQTLAEAWLLMKKSHIHHLPVLKNGQLVGCVSACYLLDRYIDSGEFEETLAGELDVEQVMMQQVVTTRAATEIRRVAYVMTLYDLNAMPVMSEGGELVGMVSRFDLIQRLAEEPPLELYV